MKKSEIIREQINALETEYDNRSKDALLDWDKFWDTFGRETKRKLEELRFELSKERNREIEIGDGVSIKFYSDSHACTVIAKTKTTITVQQDKATLDPNFKPEWVAGGFAGHCVNQDEQTYTYERDPKGAIYKCRWSEKHGRYQTGSDGSIKIYIGRHEFYDYNF